MQLRLVNGAQQPHEALVRAVQPPTRRAAETRGALYLLASAVGPLAAPTALSEEVLELAGESYYAAGGSITRGLRDAILAANECLFAYNLRVDDDRRIAMGLCCAVIREGDLYIGQMGPALALTLREGRLRRYPAHSAWIASDELMGLQLNREPPLGLRRDAEPSLYHAEMRPSDGLLLASAHLLRQASDAQLVTALTSDSERELIAGLSTLAAGASITALALRPEPDVAQPLARTSEPEATGALHEALPRAQDRDLALGPAESPVLPAREPVSEPDESLYADADEFAGAYADQDELVEEAWEEEAPSGAARRQRPRVELGEVAETVGEGARRLRRGAEDLLLNVLPTDVPERPSLPEPAAPIPMGAKALVFVALLIPLIVLFTVVMTRIQYDRVRTSQHTNAILQAQYLYDQAVRQSDTQLERQELYRALDAIQQGLSIAPDDADLKDLLRRAQHRIDQLEGVIPIYSFARLYFFEDDAVSRTDSSRIAINQKDVMVLNRGSNLLYRFFLNDVGDALQPVEANPVLIRAGDTYDGVTVSDMIDVTWMASEGSQTQARFMVLDRSGTLLSYDARRGVRAQPVGNSDIWLNPQAIGGYYGNLYVLDPLLGRLLKYLPTNNEYVKPPLDYLDAALGIDLTGAVDMAIDGSVYVLYADGAIKKYLNGVPVEFPMAGFYGAMRSPVAIHVSGAPSPDAEGYVYVADAGNQRVLQFTKDGVFLRQFRAVETEPYMEQLRGLYVDEAERRMFLISGQHFVLCTLPILER